MLPLSRSAIPTPRTRSRSRHVLSVRNHGLLEAESVYDVLPGLHVHGKNGLVFRRPVACRFLFLCLNISVYDF
jgi:hypothetical protein